MFQRLGGRDLRVAEIVPVLLRQSTIYIQTIQHLITGIDHCVSVNPAFTRPELDSDYNMKIWMVRERFVAMRRKC
jgi:hypothetical protein